MPIGPSGSSPRVDIGRKLDGDSLVCRLCLIDHTPEETRSITIIVAAADFDDPRQESHVAFVFPTTLYATLHTAHSIGS